MGEKQSARNDEPSYWFNLRTLKVEKGLKTAASFRVGPFETEDEAAAALTTIRKRAELWKDSEQDD